MQTIQTKTTKMRERNRDGERKRGRIMWIGYDPLAAHRYMHVNKSTENTHSQTHTALPQAQSTQDINPINLRLLFLEPGFISHKTIHLLQARQ